MDDRMQVLENENRDLREGIAAMIAMGQALLDVRPVSSDQSGSSAAGERSVGLEGLDHAGGGGGVNW